MIDLLSGILCVMRNVLLAIGWAGVELVNLIAAALAAFAGVILAALPEFPDAPQLPGAASDATGWLAWFVPVTGILTALSGLLVSYLIFLGARIALRWVKAL